MKQATKGATVRVHYTGTLRDGTVFDSSKLNHRPPLEFTVGAGQMIPGFDKGVEGMILGETRVLTLAPEEAYGPRREEMTLEVSRDRLPSGYSPNLGDQLQMGPHTVKVVALKEQSVVLDANHPLAGKELIFEVTLEEVLD